MTSLHDTIAAQSTPPGEAGIAVIRLSGAGAVALLLEVFRGDRSELSTKAPPFVHRMMRHGALIDPVSMEIVDEVMAVVMFAPESYTGEDVVEVSCHGSQTIVNRILSILFSLGARAAEPGEFTKRAFLNGKMDLIQAEAVADLIHSRSELQRQAAQRCLAGGLSEEIEGVARDVIELLGVVEANIDFITEDIDAVDWSGSIARMRLHRETLGGLLSTGVLAKPFREGFQVVLAGPTNAGKSTLFNRLVGESRAIVTDIPGTTRDVLREHVIKNGLVFVVHDTAGIRGGVTDQVESLGIGLANDAIAHADVVLVVEDGVDVNGRNKIDPILSSLDLSRTIRVKNKADLLHKHGAVDNDTPGVALVSAKTGAGLQELWNLIVDRVGGVDIASAARERYVLNTRLTALLARADALLAELIPALESRESLEMLAARTRELLSVFEQATGRRYENDYLDVIFSRFCIGK